MSTQAEYKFQLLIAERALALLEKAMDKALGIIADADVDSVDYSGAGALHRLGKDIETVKCRIGWLRGKADNVPRGPS
jgi:hypothetical protein